MLKNNRRIIDVALLTFESWIFGLFFWQSIQGKSMLDRTTIQLKTILISWFFGARSLEVAAFIPLEHLDCVLLVGQLREIYSAYIRSSFVLRNEHPVDFSTKGSSGSYCAKIWRLQLFMSFSTKASLGIHVGASLQYSFVLRHPGVFSTNSLAGVP